MAKATENNKPYWIICQDKTYAERIMAFIKASAGSAGCPIGYNGCHCPQDDYGNELSCRECWLRQFEIITEDENNGDKEGKE